MNPHLRQRGRWAWWTAAFAILLAPAACAQEIDESFGPRAHVHVEALAGLGPRLAGTDADRSAARYIRNAMRSAGLRVSEESVEFDSFAMTGAELTAGDLTVAVERLVFDPYAGAAEFTAAPVFLPSGDVRRTAAFVRALEGRIAIITPGSNPFEFMFPGPKAVAVVSTAAFDGLAAKAPAAVTIKVRGSRQRIRTSNVVGTAGPQDGPFVMFSAHRDSVDAAPGADDNASGIAVLLELARALRKSGTSRPARFVALAAEEVGFVGAKAYILRHRDELRRCALVVNIDTVGGEEELWLDARGGVHGTETDWRPDLRAEVAPRGIWLLSRPFTHASNVPAWLNQAIIAAGKKTGIPIQLGAFSGSDHMAFARAGVPATHIVSSTGKAHSKDDTAQNVSARALERAGRLAAAVAAEVK